MFQYNEFKQHLLAAAMLIAPNSKSQAAFARALYEYERDGVEPINIARRMVGHMYDGLAYGNWLTKEEKQS